MSLLTTTLTTLLARADEQFRAGKISLARAQYADLLERAQDKSDRPTEVVVRAMLAWCALRANDLELASDLLQAASRFIDPEHLDAYGRYRRVLVRLALERDAADVAESEMRDYLQWAEHHGRFDEALDACMMLARTSENEDRIDWLQRGIDGAGEDDPWDQLAPVFNALGAALDLDGQLDGAVDAYTQALNARLRRVEAGQHVDPRQLIAARWAVGSVSCRAEDWPLARTELERALAETERHDLARDIVPWVLSDLAHVYEAAGDVVEARRLVIRALSEAHEQSAESMWPARYSSLRAQAEHLQRID